MAAIKTLKPDSKGRIALGSLLHGVSSVKVTVDERNRIILEPFVEIPAAEAWLYRNKEAFSKVKKGLDDSANGRLHDLGSFAGFSEDD
ncbi:MAG: hypothetical protein AB7E48_04835 [Deferribacterales bacterium]